MEPIYQVLIADSAIAECCEKRRHYFSLEYPGEVEVQTENTRPEMRNCGKCVLGCLKEVGE